MGEVFKKMQVNGPEGLKLARKKSLAVSVACMAMYGPAPGLKGRTFELWVFNRWFFFNICVHSIQLWGEDEDDDEDMFTEIEGKLIFSCT